MITISNNDKTPIDLHQAGIKEHLMCESCDRDVVGKYDDYIATWFYTDCGIPPLDIGPAFICSVDYAMFRLFHLSLLWRFHIATVDGFKGFSLGSYSLRIRDMIKRGDPGDPHFFPCILVQPQEISDVLAGGLMCPIMTGTNDYPSCRASAVGLLWLWLLMEEASRHPLVAAAAARPSGEMYILKGISDITDELKRELVDMNRVTPSRKNADKLKKWGFG